MKMAPPGNSESQGARPRYSYPLRSIEPQAGVGGCTPMPRNYRLVRPCAATRRLHALLANLALRQQNSSRQTAARHLNLK